MGESKLKFLIYSGKAKYMQGVKRVEVVGEHKIGSFVLYLFYINGQRYTVSKKLVDNGKTWKLKKNEEI